MAGLDLTAASALLTPVIDRTLHSVMYSYDNAKLNPGFVSMKRGQAKTTPFGEAWELSVEVGAMGATSASYGVADTNMGVSGPTVKKFAVTPATIFTKGKLEGAVIDRCKDQGGLVQAMAYVAKSTMRGHMRKLCVLSSGNGSGALARIQAVNASPAYVDVPKGYGRRFEPNDMLVAAAAETSGGLRSATALRVIGRNVNQSATLSRIFLSGDPTALSWSAGSGGDHLFWEGCRSAVYKGHGAWAPVTAPVLGSDSFFGVDRGIDPVRLGGNRFDCSGGASLRRKLLTAAADAAGEGAAIDRCRLSIEDYTVLAADSDETKTLSVEQDKTVIGFSGIEIAGGPLGKFMVFPDESLVPGDGFVEDSSAWKCLSVDGDLARVERADGLMWRAIPGEYAYAITLVSVIQTVCERPGHVTRLFGVNQ